MKTRLYKVKCSLDGHTSPRLIEATSASTAIRHCVANNYHAETASPKDVVELMQAGVKVEKAELNERQTE